MEIDNFLPGSASLVDMIDTKLYISLRDGRHWFGYLRSYDQFANLVLMDTQERIYDSNKVFIKEIGLQIVRGENVVLIGQVEEEGENVDDLEKLTEDEAKTALERQNQEKEAKREKLRELAAKGFCVEHIVGDNY